MEHLSTKSNIMNILCWITFLTISFQTFIKQTHQWAKFQTMTRIIDAEQTFQTDGSSYSW